MNKTNNTKNNTTKKTGSSKMIKCAICGTSIDILKLNIADKVINLCPQCTLAVTDYMEELVVDLNEKWLLTLPEYDDVIKDAAESHYRIAVCAAYGRDVDALGTGTTGSFGGCLASTSCRGSP